MLLTDTHTITLVTVDRIEGDIIVARPARAKRLAASSVIWRRLLNRFGWVEEIHPDEIDLSWHLFAITWLTLDNQIFIEPMDAGDAGDEEHWTNPKKLPGMQLSLISDSKDNRVAVTSYDELEMLMARRDTARKRSVAT